MPGEFYDIDQEIAKVCSSISKPSPLVAAERDLLVKEAEIAAIRTEIAELVTQSGKDDLVGSGRQRLVAALGEHGKLMNGSATARATFYKKRAGALQATAQHALDAIAAIVDLAVPGAVWVEIAASPRLRALVAGYNKIAITQSTWCDRARAPLPLAREDAFRSIVARHRSRP